MNNFQEAEEHLPEYRVRPRFLVKTKYSTEELVNKIKVGLDKDKAPCKGKLIANKYATLFLPKEELHYWSPQLSLTFEEDEEDEEGSFLRGYYGPHPSVWTMFIFFYFIIACAIVVITIIGLSNLFLEKSILILWLLPILILLFLSLYLVAYFGQKLGHDQMVTLHQFLEESIGMPIINE